MKEYCPHTQEYLEHFAQLLQHRKKIFLKSTLIYAYACSTLYSRGFNENRFAELKYVSRTCMLSCQIPLDMISKEYYTTLTVTSSI